MGYALIEVRTPDTTRLDELGEGRGVVRLVAIRAGLQGALGVDVQLRKPLG
jgi:hypothetical protein